MVDENQVEGGFKEFGGRVQDAVGGLTGDTSTQAAGKWNEVAGQAQRTFGDAAEEVRQTVTNKPLTAMAVIGAAFFVFGFLARR